MRPLPIVLFMHKHTHTQPNTLRVEARTESTYTRIYIYIIYSVSCAYLPHIQTRSHTHTHIHAGIHVDNILQYYLYAQHICRNGRTIAHKMPTKIYGDGTIHRHLQYFISLLQKKNSVCVCNIFPMASNHSQK